MRKNINELNWDMDKLQKQIKEEKENLRKEIIDDFTKILLDEYKIDASEREVKRLLNDLVSQINQINNL